MVNNCGLTGGSADADEDAPDADDAEAVGDATAVDDWASVDDEESDDPVDEVALDDADDPTAVDAVEPAEAVDEIGAVTELAVGSTPAPALEQEPSSRVSTTRPKLNPARHGRSACIGPVCLSAGIRTRGRSSATARA